jgi:hypothetical protein
MGPGDSAWRQLPTLAPSHSTPFSARKGVRFLAARRRVKSTLAGLRVAGFSAGGYSRAG